MPIVETVAGSSVSAIIYLASLVGLATAGAVDAVSLATTNQGLLAEVGLPLEGQLGLSAVFLGGFIYLAKKFMDSQDEKFKLLTDHIIKMEKAYDEQIKKLEEEKKLLITKLTQLNDETRARLNRELDDHR